jgi:hypothetical protein
VGQPHRQQPILHEALRLDNRLHVRQIQLPFPRKQQPSLLGRFHRRAYCLQQQHFCLLLVTGCRLFSCLSKLHSCLLCQL